MDIHDFLAHLNRGEAIVGGSELHRVMHDVSQDALKLTAELNGHIILEKLMSEAYKMGKSI